MKIMLLILGYLSLFLGVLGIILPVLPTTPFLLAAIILFSKSYPQIAYKIKQNKWLGSYLDDYLSSKMMKRSAKVKSIIFIWVGLSISIYLQNVVWLMILLGVIGLIVSLHIILLDETVTKDKVKQYLDQENA